jgi:hypothetical protein
MPYFLIENYTYIMCKVISLISYQIKATLFKQKPKLKMARSLPAKPILCLSVTVWTISKRFNMYLSKKKTKKKKQLSFRFKKE